MSFPSPGALGLANVKQQIILLRDRVALPATVSPGLAARLPVTLFAGFIALLTIIAAFFTGRNGDIDELMMYNPAYMLARFGKLTIASYTWRLFYYQPDIIHPPIHIGLIGLLERIGFTWYYAEAMPVLLLLLLGILIIVSSPFPPAVKLGLLFSVGFVMSTGENFATIFGVRPEGHVYAAWFAGLLLLESGRLSDWDRTRLFFGALLLTWASGVHYYACAAFAGVLVYVIWAASDLGWSGSKSRIAALIGGGALFGIPYVALYLAPHLKDILFFIRLSTVDASIPAAVRLHSDYYHDFAHADFISALIREPMALGVPLAVFSTLILGASRYTRGIALAALPLQLFVLFFATHKLPYYLIQEIALFAGAVATGLLLAGDWLWRRLPFRSMHRIFPSLAAALLSYYLLANNPPLKAAHLVATPRVHEGDLARAATRRILGPGARVTGRDGGWYTSGADYWFDIERDMTQASHYDPASYFSNFDAAVDYNHQSEATQGDGTISAWYAGGLLKLRGFYFGETNQQLQLLLLTARPVSQVVGYATRDGQVYRFEEQPAGDFQLVSAECPMAPQLGRWNWANRWPGTYSAVTYLPKPERGEAGAVVTVLSPRSLREPAGWMRTTCRTITSLNGTLEPADKNALLEDLRRHDQPMHFPRMLEELPRYQGVILPETMTAPKESVRLDGVVKLGEIHATTNAARVERLPQIRVTTVPLLGAFSAAIPVRRSNKITGSCWLEVQLKVITGEIGLAALGPAGVIVRTPLPIVKSNEPIAVALPLKTLHDVDSIILFNDSALVGGQVDVLDASVRVMPKDPRSSNAALSSPKISSR